VLLARCPRLEGHFLGDPLVRVTTRLTELVAQVRPLFGQLRTQPGAPAPQRVGALLAIGRRLATLVVERPRRDPLEQAAARLPAEVATRLLADATREVDAAAGVVLGEVSAGA
jgi:pyruvate dehydrogenase E1 component alpha subunit